MLTDPNLALNVLHLKILLRRPNELQRERAYFQHHVNGYKTFLRCQILRDLGDKFLVRAPDLDDLELLIPAEDLVRYR